MTKVWAGASVGWAYLVIDCCTRQIVRWDLSLRCRTQEAIAAVERAVMEQMAMVLGITHRRTAFNHPEGNGLIERFHRSLKEKEVWLNEYRSLEEARDSIGRWIAEYNGDRPHRALGNRTPREARAGFDLPQPLTKTETLSV